MTAPENPLSRWSRLKRQTVSKDRADADLNDPQARSVRPATTEPEAELDQGLADAHDLPSIDAITVGTDIRAFLRNRVPVELTRAALRRAWISDPAIRDFVGIAENQWDFNDPTAISGFGPLLETDDISALLARALGQPAELVTAITELPMAPGPPALAEMVGEIGAPEQPVTAGRSDATTSEPAESGLPGAEHRGDPTPVRRSHGSALPR